MHRHCVCYMSEGRSGSHIVPDAFAEHCKVDKAQDLSKKELILRQKWAKLLEKEKRTEIFHFIKNSKTKFSLLLKGCVLRFQRSRLFIHFNEKFSFFRGACKGEEQCIPGANANRFPPKRNDEEIGGKTICVDSTHGTKSCDFKLITLPVMDDF
ncbi:hypothetical protein NPIL_235441 [Nephila pilipes]|uniref:Uncharacterized protein n=1 Tax=Nephila pilipes TaxID=299642 RepID=A0A8X6U159_NEPPI|nr:hypothetical protein NPIL_235441 [Nephila pilipes]